MKVMLAAPFYDQQRGNTVTVNRISNGLETEGIETSIINTTEKQSYEFGRDYDLVHGFHAYHFYNFMQKVNVSMKPYVITMTGTDLNQDLFNEDKKEKIIDTLVNAEAIHVFEEKGRQLVAKEIPETEKRISVIPQGVSPFQSVKNRFSKETGTFLFILPAGIRKIKQIPYAISMLALLKEKYPEIRLWLVGPVIEKAENEIVKKLVEKHKDWIRYPGQIPHSQMGELYKQGDIVLNTSLSEGQPSAILEAMSLGIVPIVFNNNGNRSIVKHRHTGFIYRNDIDFLKYAEELMKNKLYRLEIGKQGRKFVKEYHSLQHEISALTEIYKKVVFQTEDD